MSFTSLLLSQYLRYGADLLKFDWYFYIILLLSVGVMNMYIKYVMFNCNPFEQSDIERMLIRVIRIALCFTALYSVSQLVLIGLYPGLYVAQNLL